MLLVFESSDMVTIIQKFKFTLVVCVYVCMIVCLLFVCMWICFLLCVRVYVCCLCVCECGVCSIGVVVYENVGCFELKYRLSRVAYQIAHF